MRIYFCDLCDESVPQADLDAGTALLVKGRVTCAACQAAMSAGGPAQPAAEADAAAGMPATTVAALEGSPDDTTIMDASAPGLLAPAAPPPSSGQAVGVALASVALIFSVGAAAFLLGRFEQSNDELVREMQDGRADWNEAVRSIENRLTYTLRNATSGVQSSEEALNDLSARFAEVEAERADQLANLQRELASLETRLAQLEEVSAAVEQNQEELASVASTTAELHDELLRLAERASEARAEDEEARNERDATPVDTRPAWLDLTADLTSPNSGRRWQAVQALGATHDPAVAEHLVPLLDDSDIFVRMATARILGDLEAAIGIGPLIDALDDPEASVREAAVVSLRSITGRSFRFDPLAKESDRAKRIKAWRDWWKKAAEDYVG